MPDSNPTGAPATGAQGQQPGATGDASGLISQGPNDPYQPAPATGTQTQPATGDGQGQQGQPGGLTDNDRAAMRRMAEERDAAREALRQEREKGLPPEEIARLRAAEQANKDNESRVRSLVLKYEVATRAGQLGIVDPAVAVMLLEQGGKVTISDDGTTVTGLDEALKELIKERPYLVKAPASADAGAGTAGQGRPSKTGSSAMNDLIRSKARGQ